MQLTRTVPAWPQDLLLVKWNGSSLLLWSQHWPLCASFFSLLCLSTGGEHVSFTCRNWWWFKTRLEWCFFSVVLCFLFCWMLWWYMHWLSLWLLERLCWVNCSAVSNTFFLCCEIRLVVAMIEPAVMSTDIFTVSLSLSHQERWSWEKSPVRLNTCVILRCLFSSFVVLQKGDKVV